jgi:hypothetical protein
MKLPMKPNLKPNLERHSKPNLQPYCSRHRGGKQRDIARAASDPITTITKKP